MSRLKIKYFICDLAAFYTLETKMLKSLTGMMALKTYYEKEGQDGIS